MRAIATGWRLAKDSWRVLVADRSLAVFPILSFVSAALALALFLVPGLIVGSRSHTDGPIIFYGLIGSYAATFCTVYFNVALAGAAVRSMAGQETSVRDGLVVARKRVLEIACWAAVQWAVGLALQAIEMALDDTPFERLAGRLVSWLLGAAWGLATFFVVPVLAFEDRGPTGAMKRSVSLIRGRWGEGIAGNVGIGLATLVYGFLPAGALIALGVLSPQPAVAWPALTLGILAAGGVAVISSTLTVIFRVALYRYAILGAGSAGFSDADLAASFRGKGR